MDNTQQVSLGKILAPEQSRPHPGAMDTKPFGSALASYADPNRLAAPGGVGRSRSFNEMSCTVSETVWQKSNAQGTELLVLLCMANYSNCDGICWPAVATIAGRVKRDIRTVQRAIKSLCEAGEVTVMNPGGVKKVKGITRHYSNVYRILLVSPTYDYHVDVYPVETPEQKPFVPVDVPVLPTPSDKPVAEVTHMGDKTVGGMGDTGATPTVIGEPSVQALAKANGPAVPAPVPNPDKPVGPPEPAKPKSASRTWHPESQRFLDLFAVRYRTVHGVAYAATAKDKGCANTLLHATSAKAEDLVAVAEKAWGAHPAVARLARQVSTFSSMFNHIQAEVANGTAGIREPGNQVRRPIDYSKGF